MSPDPTSPNSRKRAYSPPSRSRAESSQPWWDSDRQSHDQHSNSRSSYADQRSNHGQPSSSSRQLDRERARERDGRGYAADSRGGGREWDSRGSHEQQPRYAHGNGGVGYGGRGGMNGRGGGFNGGAPRGGSFAHNRDSSYQRSPPRDAHQSLYPNQSHTQYDQHRHDQPPSTRAGSDRQPSPAPPASAFSAQAPAPPAPPAKQGTPEPELELEIPVERDPAELLAERRKKREAILAKYALQQSAANSSTAGTPAAIDTPGAASPANAKPASEVGSVTSAAGEPALKRARVAGTESPAGEEHSAEQGGVFSLEKTGADQAAPSNEAGANGDGEDISAADYDPEMERANDDRRKNSRGPLVEDHQNDWRARERAEEDKQKQQKQSLAVVQDDDDDDDDDMFAVDSKPIKKVGIEQAEEDQSAAAVEVPMIDRSLDAVLVDEFDDSDGYYKLLLGEVLDNGRYHVRANLGKGMFATVVRAKDLHSKRPDGSHEEVAIKVIRSQESMYKAGQKEAAILRKLNEADPTDKKHVVRLLRTFEHRGHLCLVFENLAMNLREVVKRFGKDVGINLRAVRAYASQMFLALSLFRKCDIMHADIKPDNILVNESKSTLKICDLGSASDTSENDITPYLVSRFYRAPEIILGLPYDPALDVWSIGCTLYELYTGKILFPGRTNNHMLQLMMELKGKINAKQLKKGKFTEQHFDEQLNFIAVDKNDVKKTTVIPPKAANDLRQRLLPQSVVKGLKEDELKLMEKFVDVLEKMLSLDPAKRPTPKELLNHPYLRG